MDNYSSDDDSDIIIPGHPMHQMIHRMETALEKSLPNTGGGRGIFDVWDDKDAGFHVRLDMPGMDKENVKVWVERKALCIRGEGPEWGRHSDRGDITAGRKYVTEIALPTRRFKLSEIQTEVKFGVLRVMIPSAEERESTVNVEVA